jgi:hypothetical protein
MVHKKVRRDDGDVDKTDKRIGRQREFDSDSPADDDDVMASVDRQPIDRPRIAVCELQDVVLRLVQEADMRLASGRRRSPRIRASFAAYAPSQT